MILCYGQGMSSPALIMKSCTLNNLVDSRLLLSIDENLEDVFLCYDLDECVCTHSRKVIGAMLHHQQMV